MNDTGADWNGYAFLRRPSDFGGSGCYCGVCGADLNFLLVVGSCDGYVGNAAEAMLIRRYRGHIPFHRDRERLPGRNRVVAADLRSPSSSAVFLMSETIIFTAFRDMLPHSTKYERNPVVHRMFNCPLKSRGCWTGRWIRSRTVPDVCRNAYPHLPTTQTPAPPVAQHDSDNARQSRVPVHGSPHRRTLRRNDAAVWRSAGMWRGVPSMYCRRHVPP